MEALELDGFASEDWNALIDGERDPWGGTGETLAWRGSPDWPEGSARLCGLPF
jgi:hypothetical protein